MVTCEFHRDFSGEYDVYTSDTKFADSAKAG